MPSITAAIAASAAAGLWRPINDDRVHVHPANGLALVVDASGPTYGGYYAPFAIDPALAELRETFAASVDSTRERLETSIRAAHGVMRTMLLRHETCRAGRGGLDAALHAANAIRPPAWQGVESLAHFAASLTACAVGVDSVVVAQVGDCRAYRLDTGTPELLVRDHTLASALEASGASREDVEHAREVMSDVVVAQLGGDTLPLNAVELRAPVTIALVTNGIWRSEAALQELCHTRTQHDLESLAARSAAATRDDATAVVIEIR